MRRFHPLGTARRAFLGKQLEGRAGEPLPPETLVELEGLAEVDASLTWLAWELVRCDASLGPDEQRRAFFLAAAALISLRRGSTRLPLEGRALGELLGTLGLPEEELEATRGLLDEERRIFGPADGPAPLVVEGGHLYLRKVLDLEARLAGLLRSRLVRGEPPPGAEEAVRDVWEHPPHKGATPLPLTDEQVEAVRRAVVSPLTVISGGPGTGKTSIVVSILRALRRMGAPLEAIALAAPTGKAAHRLEESIRAALELLPTPSAEDRELLEHAPEPRTLHRILGFAPSTGRFRHHGENPLAHQVVIVDEASMVDLTLMERLLVSLRPEAQLVLLGDADQLPSVEAGAVLRDLIPGGGADPRDPRWNVALALRKSFRMDPRDPAGRAILTLANAINRGDREATAEGLVERGGVADLRFEGVELVAGGQRRAFFERWYQGRIASFADFGAQVRWTWRVAGDRFEAAAELHGLFDHLERSRILCATWVAPTGAEAINDVLHRIHADAHRLDPGHRLLPGEPVLIQRNDYQRGLFNGDQGVVLWVADEGAQVPDLRVVFRRGEEFVTFPAEALAGSLLPAWAMTVHKSQGSEFDAVAVMLPDEDLPLLTREILYTALTRARRSVVLVGDRGVLDRGVARRIERHSGIVERLLR